MKLIDTRADHRYGVLFGSAYGDALGRPTEFMKMKDLKRFGNPFHGRVGINAAKQGIVSDDTQMAIAVAHAALGKVPADPADLTEQFVKFFIMWRNDPASFDGQRAPGGTCTGAVDALKRNPKQWLLATRPDSKGNGANMRVAPLALRTDWSMEEMAGAAQLQAAITHGHPTALAASELTAVAVRMLLGGTPPNAELIGDLLSYALAQRNHYRGKWVGTVWEAATNRPPIVDKQSVLFQGNAGELGFVRMPMGPRFTSPEQYIRRGWDEVIDALLRVYKAPRDRSQDPCRIGGEGWVAEEALACSLHILACFPDDPANALRRAAFSNGDSDSLGAITGALAGAAYGLRAFPSHWLGNIEYRQELESLSGLLDSAARRKIRPTT